MDPRGGGFSQQYPFLQQQQPPQGVRQGQQGFPTAAGPQGAAAANVLGRFGGTSTPLPSAPQQPQGPQGQQGSQLQGGPRVKGAVPPVPLQGGGSGGGGLGLGQPQAVQASPRPGSQTGGPLRTSGSGVVGGPGGIGMGGAAYSPGADLFGMFQPTKGSSGAQPSGPTPPQSSYNHQAALSNLLDRTLQSNSGVAQVPGMHQVEEADFDMSSFPFIARGPGAAAGPAGPKNEPEFSLGADDFPALPGHRATGEPEDPQPSVHYQQTANAGQVPFGNKNQQMSSAYLNSLQTDSGLPPTSLPGASNLSTFQEFMQRQQQQTKPFADRFGLLGLLSVIRMTDPDLNTLALGTDLTTLGLNLNSPDCLYSTFASPFAEGPSRREPEFYIPICYSVQNQLQSPKHKMNLFSDETLFYIFYAMPRDSLQLAASNELFKRDWRFHKELKLWFTRAPGSEPVKSGTHERGSYIYFDLKGWEKMRKDNLVLAYEQLETTAP